MTRLLYRCKHHCRLHGLDGARVQHAHRGEGIVQQLSYHGEPVLSDRDACRTRCGRGGQGFYVAVLQILTDWLQSSETLQEIGHQTETTREQKTR